METLLQDIRYGARMLAKNPAFAIVAVLILALGIGANVAMFSVIDAVLLRPLPFQDPEQLVRIVDDLPGLGVHDVGMTVPEMTDLRDRSGLFDQVSVVWPINANLTGSDRPTRVEALAVSPSYFSLLGARPELGRVFTAHDEVPGFSEGAVISDAMWRRQFGAEPGVLGKKIRLDNDLYTIIGVMPPGFRHPGRTLATEEDVWVAAGYSADPFPHPPARNLRFLPSAIARLKPGITLPQAQAALSTFAFHLQEEFPNDYPQKAQWTPRLVSLKEDLVGNVRPLLAILLGAVALVLLIGCVNIANLLLARSISRQREIAIRLVLGAGRARLIRQLLTESILLSLLGGTVALLAIVWLRSLLISMLPTNLPRLNEIAWNGGILAFAFFTALLTGTFFGLIPAIQAARQGFAANLKEGSQGSGAGMRQARLQQALVVSEFAMCLVLMIGAALLLRSFGNLLQVQPGFESANVLIARTWLPVPNDPKTNIYAPPEKRDALMRELLRRANSIPGVEQTALGNSGSVPLAGRQNIFPFSIEDRPLQANENLVADFAFVSPDYFRVLGIPLRSGRAFAETDDEKAPGVVLINESMARTYWPGENAIGKRLKPGQRPNTPWSTIVGIVADMKADSLDIPSAPEVYFPAYANGPYDMVVFARTRMTPESLAESLRQEIAAVDSNLPVFGARSMGSIVSSSLVRRKFAMQVIGLFALAALLLAGMGIYGVLSYSTSQRTHEIGIRVALGAQPQNIMKLVLIQAMSLVLAGTFAGLAAAFALTRLLKSFLFGVAPNDSLTYAGVAMFLIVVALLACYIPARRATKVDPLVALRHE
ncbi:MAG: ABC transporter permease [Candidatus Acidiferrales bacterium]